MEDEKLYQVSFVGKLLVKASNANDAISKAKSGIDFSIGIELDDFIPIVAVPEDILEED